MYEIQNLKRKKFSKKSFCIIFSILLKTKVQKISSRESKVFYTFFCCAPFGYLYLLSFQLLSEPELVVGINPVMALTPFPSSVA
jgi:hypothetical protein